MSRRSGHETGRTGATRDGTAHSETGRESAPLGVKAIAVFGGFSALLSILVGVGGVLALPTVGGDVVTLLVALTLFGAVLGAGKLVALYGLVNMEPWGYKWTMGLYGLGLVVSLLSFSAGLLNGLFSLVVIGYLWTKRDLFGTEPSTPTRTGSESEGTVRRRGPGDRGPEAADAGSQLGDDSGETGGIEYGLGDESEGGWGESEDDTGGRATATEDAGGG